MELRNHETYPQHAVQIIILRLSFVRAVSGEEKHRIANEPHQLQS